MSRLRSHNEIVTFDPFFAEYDSYDGRHVSVTFTCPYCGSHSVKRTKFCQNDRHFFQNHFRCKICCKGSYLGEPFYYASPVFIRHYSETFVQLTLF